MNLDQQEKQLSGLDEKKQRSLEKMDESVNTQTSTKFFVIALGSISP